MNNGTVETRSILSKERIAVLEELISDNNSSYDSAPGVYVRSNKDKELDLLWQSFKNAQKEDKSPGIYLTVGFLTGALCMFLMSTFLNFGHYQEGNAEINLWKKGSAVVASKIKIAPADTAKTTESVNKIQKHKIQSGETLASVALKYYGNSGPDYVKKIQDANGIQDPNKISIGQELTVPVQQ